MSTVVLPREMSRALMDLTGEPRPDVALILLVREYSRYKMAEIDESIRQLEEKYGMDFDAYRQLWETEDDPAHYHYAAEQDYLEWDALVARRCRLEASFAWLQ
jgi:hypothetical protein